MHARSFLLCLSFPLQLFLSLSLCFSFSDFEFAWHCNKSKSKTLTFLFVLWEKQIDGPFYRYLIFLNVRIYVCVNIQMLRHTMMLWHLSGILISNKIVTRFQIMISYQSDYDTFCLFPFFPFFFFLLFTLFYL